MLDFYIKAKATKQLQRRLPLDGTFFQMHLASTLWFELSQILMVERLAKCVPMWWIKLTFLKFRMSGRYVWQRNAATFLLARQESIVIGVSGKNNTSCFLLWWKPLFLCRMATVQLKGPYQRKNWSYAWNNCWTKTNETACTDSQWCTLLILQMKWKMIWQKHGEEKENEKEGNRGDRKSRIGEKASQR